MTARVSTTALLGIEIIVIEVQVQLLPGIPGFSIVGLPNKVVAESKERIKSAINAMGLAIPAKKIVVNLSPASLVKEGSHYDLAIAVGILIEMGIVPHSSVAPYLFLGELALDSQIVAVPGVLPAALKAKNIQKGIICPACNGNEAALIEHAKIVAPRDMIQLVQHLKGDHECVFDPSSVSCQQDLRYDLSLSDIKGQFFVKRAAEIAAAGRHNLLLVGPPGSGKSMLAERIVTLLPKLSPEETLEVNVIRSIVGALEVTENCVVKIPYRAPHHSCSVAAMVGGGRYAKPGEISRAHRGILFLDELPEFSRAVLESLRQPLESGKVTISRAESQMTYPADVQLVAAMNPCKCGYAGTRETQCVNDEQCMANYFSKISGPLLDRIDLRVSMHYVDILEYVHDGKIDKKANSEETIRARVEKARLIQKKRYAKHGIEYNTEASWDVICQYVQLDDRSLTLLRKVSKLRKFSNRTMTKVMQIARTVADLEAAEHVSYACFAEALNFNSDVSRTRIQNEV